MPSPFVHLHVRSHYSLLSGLGKIDELVQAAKEDNMEALAVTDTSNLYGAVELTVAAQKAGIKPIIGCELRVVSDMRLCDNSAAARKSYQLVLLVVDETGYHNLMRLITAAHLEGFCHEPRVDKKLLRRYARGLIALSGWLEGEIPEKIIDRDEAGAEKAAREYAEIFGKDNFYLELQHHTGSDRQKLANEGCLRLHKKLGLPLVATSSVYYLKPEDAQVQDIAECIAANRKVDEPNRPTLTDFDLSFRRSDTMRADFADLPEALENTKKIADRCNFTIKLGETQLPHYELPAGVTPDQALRRQCEKALVKRFGRDGIMPMHRRRMDYELEIIRKTGYASYFLIVQDFVNWARRQGIVVGPGRGSAAGSFVSYLTGITNIDPIKYDLLFERFLNPERVSMPDVDLDFADDRRDEVIQYVREKYGADHVSQIITFGTMAARAAVRDAGRALNYPYDYCDKLSKMIPMFTSIDKALEVSPEFGEIYANDPAAKRLVDAARRLEGIARHTSVHACGVVITKEPVVEYTPLQRAPGDEQATVTQYASSTKFSSVEKIGLLKMDFLGLKNLTIIQNTLRIVEATGGGKIDIDNIPLDDPQTYELLQKGLTTGVFQLESGGMKRYLKKLKPTVFEDIIAMVALYRPGPMDWIPDFIDNKHGRKKVKYLHPKLEPILSDTYGVAVYQEQVMRIAQDLAGFTLGEADILRKAMGKKIVELIKEQKEKFIDGCVKNGIDRPIAEKVFAFIEPFAGYGFNRSHAACYALIGYQTAYLKAHHPAAFMAALMTSDQAHIERIAIDVAECRGMGLEILPPDVNESFRDFAVVPSKNGPIKQIRFGLNAIKGVGHDVADAIVKERKQNGRYRNLSDFVRRLENKIINKKSLEALIMVGALDGFGERGRLLHNIPKILAFAKEVHAQRDSAQTCLFGDDLFGNADIPLDEAEPADEQQRLAWEKQLLGLYVSGHPSNRFAEYLREVAEPIDSVLHSEKKDTEREVIVGGTIVDGKKILTKKNQPMMFVTLEDEQGAIECLAFPKIYEEFSSLLTEGQNVLIKGRLSDKDDTPKIIINEIKPIDQGEILEQLRVRRTIKKHSVKDSDHTETTKVVLAVPAGTELAQISELAGVLSRCRAGLTHVYLRHDNITMQTPYRVDFDKVCREKIAQIIPEIEVIETKRSSDQMTKKAS